VADVTVITPSLPERAVMLAEAVASVNAQTHPPADHMIAVDHSGRGPALIRDQLLKVTRTEWVAFLDDDDLLDPDHLEVLLDLAQRERADVVYSWCRFEGPPLPAKYFNRRYQRETLRRHGIFPITVATRWSAIVDAGSFRADERYEDWELWNRMADQGARFAWTDRITWTYGRGHACRTEGDAA
jgi:glycosyltransferase involved in cell wall biosynthesis